MGKRQLALRRLRRALVAAAQEPLEAFLEEQRLVTETPDPDRARELEPYAVRLVSVLHQTLDAHLDWLADAAFPLDTAKAVLREMVEDWSRSREPITTLAAPPGLISRHPDVKELLAPEPPATST